MSLKINENELQDILNEVAEDLAKAFQFTEAELAKNLVKGYAKEEMMKDDGAPEMTEETPGEDHAGSPPAEGSEGSEVAPEEAPSPDADPAPEGDMPEDPAADQGAELTPESLQAEYSQLSPEELDMHIQAALAAKAAMGGAGDAGMPAPGGMPPEGAAPMGPPPGEMPPPAMKAELAPSPERSGKNTIDSVAKFEKELDGLKALVKSQADEISALVQIATKIVEQPIRKAVTTVSYIPKTDNTQPLTKEAIHSRLKALAARPDLKKADRQVINDFYDGRVRVDALAHLFEDYK